MTDILIYLPELALAYFAYLVATISPGPANLAIMATSMRHGRTSGLSIAAGVVLGSLTWGILAAFGLSTFLFSFGWLMSTMKIAGGIYLLWLAYKSFKSAASPDRPIAKQANTERSTRQHFLRGLGIHLTNPKSIFAWLSIIAIGVNPEAPLWITYLIVAGCWFFGIIVFGGYAMLFSTERMIGLYRHFRRWIEGVTGFVFGLAGLKLLSAKI